MDKLAIIIPFKNERAHTLDGCLESVRASFGGHQKCVLVGPHPPPKLRLFDEISCDYIQTPNSSHRAEAMNLGAEKSKASTIFFLHADCQLPLNAKMELEKALGQNYQAGAFLKSYASPPFLLRLQEKALNFSAFRFKRGLVGTNGLFIERETFLRLGGYPNQSFLEDVLFFKNHLKVLRFFVSPEKMRVSSRAYASDPFQIARNLFIYLLAHLRVSPTMLRKLYR